MVESSGLGAGSGFSVSMSASGFELGLFGRRRRGALDGEGRRSGLLNRLRFGLARRFDDRGRLDRVDDGLAELAGRIAAGLGLEGANAARGARAEQAVDRAIIEAKGGQLALDFDDVGIADDAALFGRRRCR